MNQMKILSNKARCRKCGDVIESKSVHDFQTCSCGAICVDGGLDYLKRGAKNFEDLEELSEYEVEGSKKDAVQKDAVQKEEPAEALKSAKYCLEHFRQNESDSKKALIDLASGYAKAMRRARSVSAGADEASRYWIERRAENERRNSEERIYLAGMYSSPDPDVRRLRSDRLSAAAGLLMKQGCLVFSPISHSGFIVEKMDGLPENPDFWLRQCDTYLRNWTTKVLILPNEDWWTSYGVCHEIKAAKELGIPVEIAFPLMDAVLMHEQGALAQNYLVENRLDSGDRI